MATIINLDHIRTDGGTQFRVTLNQATVDEYAEAMQEGAVFPPVEVFSDGTSADVWLSDGFHRIAAAKKAGFTEFPCDVLAGTQRDAVLKALSANHNHGLRRSNDDKRKAVVFCLRDPELRQLSQHQIAKLCGVTQPMVSKVASQIAPKSDNGYQFDTPAQVVEAMSSADRAMFVKYMTQRSNWIDGKDKKKLERLGLITDYSWKVERTALAADTLNALLESDSWLKLETTLYQENDRLDYSQRVHLSDFGVIKPALEMLLAANGWVEEDQIEDYNTREWIKLLVRKGYVHHHTLKIHVDGHDWTFDWYHIAPDGCKLLDLPYSIPIRYTPSVEDATKQYAMEKARREQAEAERQARRDAEFDPQQQGERERRDLLWAIDQLRNHLERVRCLDLNVDLDYDAVLQEMKADVKGAAIIDPRQQQSTDEGEPEAEAVEA